MKRRPRCKGKAPLAICMVSPVFRQHRSSNHAHTVSKPLANSIPPPAAHSRLRSSFTSPDIGPQMFPATTLHTSPHLAMGPPLTQPPKARSPCPGALLPAPLSSWPCLPEDTCTGRGVTGQGIGGQAAATAGPSAAAATACSSCYCSGCCCAYCRYCCCMQCVTVGVVAAAGTLLAATAGPAAAAAAATVLAPPPLNLLLLLLLCRRLLLLLRLHTMHTNAAPTYHTTPAPGRATSRSTCAAQSK